MHIHVGGEKMSALSVYFPSLCDILTESLNGFCPYPFQSIHFIFLHEHAFLNSWSHAFYVFCM
jgi:hypothetical protein